MKNGILAAGTAAGIMGLVLTSGLIDVNIEHHLNLPAELSNKNTISVHNRSFFVDWFTNAGTRTDIRLDDEIKRADSVKDIVKILQEATKNDTIVFHIAGYGGSVDTVLLLINNIKVTAAHTVMIVEGPSYSGHAYLATQGNELLMLPYSFLMFHTSSAYGEDCATKKGTDRTVSNVEHCLDFLQTHLGQINRLLDNITILTPEEKVKVKTGHDVYITSQQYYNRTKK